MEEMSKEKPLTNFTNLTAWNMGDLIWKGGECWNIYSIYKICIGKALNRNQGYFSKILVDWLVYIAIGI